MIDKIIEWLKGQPFNNLLTLLLLAMIAWLGWYGVTQAIPQHLSTIQAGYERIEASHTKQLESQEKAFDRALDRIASKQQPAAAEPSKTMVGSK